MKVLTLLCKTLAALLCVHYILIQPTAVAQTSEDKHDNIMTNRWALQFQITDNFSLSSFQGSTISTKYHFSNKKALRCGISLNGNIEDSDNDSKRMGNTDTDDSYIGVTITSQYIFYSADSDKFKFFWGCGPKLRYSSDTKTTESNDFRKTKAEMNTFGAGISGVIGVEWFISGNISLLAEYGSSVNYYKTRNFDSVETRGTEDSHYEEIDENVTKTNKFSLEYESIKFGLAVYF